MDLFYPSYLHSIPKAIHAAPLFRAVAFSKGCGGGHSVYKLTKRKSFYIKSLLFLVGTGAKVVVSASKEDIWGGIQLFQPSASNNWAFQGSSLFQPGKSELDKVEKQAKRDGTKNIGAPKSSTILFCLSLLSLFYLELTNLAPTAETQAYKRQNNLTTLQTNEQLYTTAQPP